MIKKQTNNKRCILCNCNYFTGQTTYFCLVKLLCKTKYDLPKGKKEDNESFLDAAMREVYEETGLFFNKRTISFLKKNYQIKKNTL